MRILITGGAGLVGSHCAEYFAKLNSRNKVIVLDNLARSRLFGYNRRSVEFNWRYLRQFKNIELIKGDVRNIKHIERAVGKGVDAVIHTAGQPGVPSSVRMPLDDFSINALGTLQVLEVVHRRSPSAAVVYCSTNKVYGENVDRIPLEEKETRYVYKDRVGVDESMPTDLAGHTPYGVSKLTGDLYTQEYGYIYKMKTAVFRMSCIYGTRQFGFEDQGWVAWFIIATYFNKPITVYGDGKQVRDMLYVDDLVDAFGRFIESDIRHEVFNIGGGPDNTISLREFLAELESLVGKKPLVSYSSWRPSDQKVYISDITKVKEKLGWAPKIGVKQGIQYLVDWVKSHQAYF